MAKQVQAVAAKLQNQLLKQFMSALRCGTPLIGITTADQFAVVKLIAEKINGNRAFISWDCIKGFCPVTPSGREALGKFCSTPSEITMLADACATAASPEVPERTVLFIHNAQRYIEEAAPAQAISNLRDVFKAKACCIVLLGPQLNPPSELAGDIVVLDEPLPNAEQLAAIIDEVHKNAGIESTVETTQLAVEAVQGLSAFAAEQVTAMSLEVDEVAKKITGLNLESLWERKRKQVEQTPGLSISREGIKFADLGGLDVAKEYLKDTLQGNDRPNTIVFIDEIEKVMAGAAGDTSGVSQDQHGALLSYMQNNKCAGILLVGHPGSGKSAIAKAVGNEAGVPTITLDLGATKGSLVGQSEGQLRDALKVITAVSNGKSMWIATSNGINKISPELKRRFKDGTFFFDLPNSEEREAIWKVHRAAYKIKASDAQPNDTGWTGAEIEQCCRKSWQLNKPLAHAAKFIVPVSQADPNAIEALRSQADGRWLSASHEGVYQRDTDAQQVATAQAGPRKISVE